MLVSVPRHYAAARSSFGDELKGAAGDVVGSFRQSRLWLALGANDILSRYRGSLLGPFWITLTTVVFVAGIGLLYARLMGMDIQEYLPWIATSMVVWNMINQTILDGADALIQAANILRQTAIPLPLFIWRVMWRNLLSFAHQLPVVLGVSLIFHYTLRINLPEAVLGLALVLFNLGWIGLCAAIACARFRDLQQVIASIMQLVFFFSPVIWIPGQMRGGRGDGLVSNLLAWNPIAQMLDLTRNPLLGRPISLYSLEFLVIMGAAGWAVTLLFFAAVRRRIVHFV